MHGVKRRSQELQSQSIEFIQYIKYTEAHKFAEYNFDFRRKVRRISTFKNAKSMSTRMINFVQLQDVLIHRYDFLS
jgi:hypothetical protein